MEHHLGIAALWLGLAVLSAVFAYHLRVSIALIEICVGMVVAAIAAFFGMTADALGANLEWLRFIAASGAVLLTFLAGAELDPDVIQSKLGEVTDDIGAVRPVPRHRDATTVFLSGGGCHRQRRGPHAYRQLRVPAPASLARSGGRVNGGIRRGRAE